MSIYLIGSQALSFHIKKLIEKGFVLSKPRRFNEKEYDLIMTEPEDIDYFRGMEITQSKSHPGKFHAKKDGIVFEVDGTQNISNSIFVNLEKLYQKNNINVFGIPMRVAPLALLYSIKRSHANFDVHFEKTIFDVNYMQKNKMNDPFRDISLMGLTLQEEKVQYYLAETNNINFIRARKHEAEIRFAEKQNKINLNKTNEDFFKGGDNLRTYVHDDLHKAVAFMYESPMYLKCKRDINSAKIERDLFDKLNIGQQIMMAQEEAMVIALERFLIPGTITDQKIAFRQGLIKLTKDLCKGWFQDFIIDNFSQILDLDINYYTKFIDALELGRVRRK